MPSATDSLAALLARYGQPPPQSVGPSYGTQATPLDYFEGAAGTGNKTTNKDLPDWLRKLGMKGDAYAGGMLKPQIRYGFWFKDGKINFADGTSFSAKKNKDGTFSYTDAAGKAATYKPTDEQDTYNKKYQNATANQSFVDKLGATADRTRQHVHDILHGAGQALQGKGSIFGGTPLGTKLSNAVTGRHDKPIADQYGGPTKESQAKYVAAHGDGALGYQPALHAVGSAIASYYAGNYGIGQLGRLGSVGTAASTGTTAADTAAAADSLPEVVVTATRGGAGLGTAGGLGASATSIDGGTGMNGPKNPNSGTGIFSNGGKNGLTGVGMSDAQRLAASGAIGGGAGVGGTSSALGTGTSGSGANVAGTSGTTNWMDWIGPLINAGTSLAASNAANGAVKNASQAAIAEQRRQFDTVRSDTAPARALGAAAIGRLAALNGYNDTNTPDFSSFTASPDYQFNLAEGQKAIDRSATAHNGLLSGAAVKEGIRYASGKASGEYAGFVDRLMQQAGLGSTGIAASAASGANAANNISNTNMNAGNARASIYQDTGANINNAAQSGISNYMLRRYLGG